MMEGMAGTHGFLGFITSASTWMPQLGDSMTDGNVTTKYYMATTDRFSAVIWPVGGM